MVLNSIFEIDLGLSEEYKPWVMDIMKVTTFQTVAHLLSMYTSGNMSDAFNREWLQTLIFVLIGFTVFWLLVNKLIHIKYN